MSDIWNEKNTVCWSPTKFIKEMNKLQARIEELEAERDALWDWQQGMIDKAMEMSKELSGLWEDNQRLVARIAEERSKTLEQIRNKHIADIEAKLAALREAAQTVVASQMNARMTQSTHWKDVTVDALQQVLLSQGE